MSLLKVTNTKRRHVRDNIDDCKLFIRGVYYTWVVTVTYYRYVERTETQIRVEGRDGSRLVFDFSALNLTEAAFAMKNRERLANSMHR